jgi:putative DNA primase/helicase
MTVAFWRRWLVIEFPNQFPQDPAFFEKTFTEEEIEGIIFVSLLAFRNAWLKRKFSFEESEADYKEMWLRNTNSIYAFISDLLNGKIEGYRAEKDPEGKVDSSELYEIYTKYCESEEREAEAKRIFTLEMERLGYKTVRTAKARYYKGLKLIQA